MQPDMFAYDPNGLLRPLAGHPSRILAFERAALEGFLDRNDDIRAALERSIAGDLRHKLAATTQTLTEDRRGGRVTL